MSTLSSCYQLERERTTWNRMDTRRRRRRSPCGTTTTLMMSGTDEAAPHQGTPSAPATTSARRRPLCHLRATGSTTRTIILRRRRREGARDNTTLRLLLFLSGVSCLLSSCHPIRAFSTAPSNHVGAAVRRTARIRPSFALQAVNDNENDQYDDVNTNDEDISASSTPSSSASDSVSSASFELLQRQLQQQQEQISTLLQLLQQQQQQQKPEAFSPSSPTHPQQQPPLDPAAAMTTSVPTAPLSPGTPPAAQQAATVTAVPPLKAMLFIDGTWLYYSIYERPARDCPLVQKYGRGWQLRYTIDWTKLPGILCHELLGASSIVTSQQRPLEIVRASVYTSSKADTSPNSYRYKLFQDLQAANYDVHMMETVGKSEKCVDIQLAVEMLHYATLGTSSSYDIALVLTGDKDFIPAMIRTRQKGKAVGVVSMKRGCNRALLDTPGLRDFDVLWLEDYLDQLVVPKKLVSSGSGSSDGGGGSNRNNSNSNDEVATPKVSLFTLYKVIHDFIRESEHQRVSSRDLGRYLKFLSIAPGDTLLDEIKLHSGLHAFLTSSGQFATETDDFQEDETDHSYWVSLAKDADAQLLEEARRSKFTAAEKLFFQDLYSLAPLRADPDRFYSRTRRLPPAMINGSRSSRGDSSRADDDDDDDLNFLTHDYSKLKVPELKAICREHGLPVSGAKATLIERIEKRVEEKMAATAATKKDKAASLVSSSSSNDPMFRPLVKPEVASYLEGLVEEYLHAKGGEASSRDLGRYLAANKPSVNDGSSRSALQELKSAYGGLRIFVACHPERFCVKTADDDEKTHEYEFIVGLTTTTTTVADVN